MAQIIAKFVDYKMGEKAVGALIDHGALKENISFVGPQDGKDYEKQAETGITTTTGSDAAEGAAKGVGIGLLLGAAGVLASLIIPGFGLVAGGGALATAMGTAAGTVAAGAVAGGVAGYLQDQGMDVVAAQEYDDAIKNGGAVLEITSPSGKLLAVDIDAILNKYQASVLRTLGPVPASVIVGEPRNVVVPTVVNPIV